MPTDPATGPISERVDAAARANRWLSPAKTIVGAAAGCLAVVIGVAASDTDVALAGVTWLTLLVAGKFVLAVLGNAYRPRDKRYQHGFYASVFGTDREARDPREHRRDPGDS